MKHGSLFSGIGGFDLAAEWMGWENIFHCEWNEFGQKVLKYYWPNAISYGDITKTDFSVHRGRIDIITGGFPCQPFSMAGKRKGTEDERHLWPEMLRVIREVRPTWVVGENVFGITNWDGGLVFEQVQADLEAEGYEVQPYVLPACAVNAPHRRDRVWFVAHRSSQSIKSDIKRGREERGCNRTEMGCVNSTNGSIGTSAHSNSNRFYGCNCEHEVNTGEGGVNALNDVKQIVATDTEGLRVNRTEKSEDNNRQGGKWGRRDADNTCKIQGRNDASYTETERLEGNDRRQLGRKQFIRRTSFDRFPTQPPLYSRNDGIPSRLVGITFSKHRNESIKAYGNAIVPHVVLQIFKAIQQYEDNKM